MDYTKYFKSLLLLALGSVLLTSCLENEVEQKIAEAEQKLRIYLDQNGYTESNNIGYNIYVKIEGEVDETAPKPVEGQSVVVDYTGKYTDNQIFETTDSSLAHELPAQDRLSFEEAYIFGPKRLKLGQIIYGLDAALRTLPEGAKAEIVIPHEYAFGGYKPVVFNVEVHEVIKSDSAWEAETVMEFFTLNDFDTSIYIAKGLFYKPNPEFGDTTLRSDTKVTYNDTITMMLEGRYAENYYGNALGRVFWPRPLDSERDTIQYLWGTTSVYPILPAIDSAVKYMRIGQEMDIAMYSGAFGQYANTWGYGNSGVYDTYWGLYIITAFTPLHYNIKLLRSTAE